MFLDKNINMVNKAFLGNPGFLSVGIDQSIGIH